jgi:TetR/AcrR family transcriptional regulator
MPLGFAQKTRHDARIDRRCKVHENERLQLRINQLPTGSSDTEAGAGFAMSQKSAGYSDPSARANLIMSYVTGRWHQFAKSGFKRDPMRIGTNSGRRCSRIERRSKSAFPMEVL